MPSQNFRNEFWKQVTLISSNRTFPWVCDDIAVMEQGFKLGEDEIYRPFLVALKINYQWDLYPITLKGITNW